MTSTNYKKTISLIKSLRKHENEIIFFPLARQKFSEDCDKIYKTILSEIERIAKRIIIQNSKSDKYFIFHINSCGFVEFAVLDTDSITTLEQDPMNWDLSIKKQKYFNPNDKKFDGYSLMLFERALNEIVTINKKLDKWKQLEKQPRSK
jgi:hypothetical protein